MIVEYIAAHWPEWLFMALAALAGSGYRHLSHKLQQAEARNEAIAEGVQSLLRESIVTNYNKYSDRHCCPIYAKESLKRVYAAYHDLGGNDVATSLYHKLLEMPEEEDG